MQLTPDDIRTRYDREAASYDRRIAVLERLTGIRKMRKTLLQHAEGSLLLVAVGTGRDLPYLPRTCTVTGIDLSEEMLSIAKNRANRLGIDTALQVMDAEAMAFADGTFDTVVSTLALCTFPHPLNALREMQRVCRTDGKLLLLEHGASSCRPLGVIQRLLNWHWIRRIGCHLDREPLDLVTGAGLRVTAHRRRLLGILHAIEARR